MGYNRKFDIKKDFSQLNELENEILTQIESKKVKDYVRKTFFNQYKQ